MNFNTWLKINTIPSYYLRELKLKFHKFVNFLEILIRPQAINLMHTYDANNTEVIKLPFT